AAHAMKSSTARTARKARTTPAIWTSLSLAVNPSVPLIPSQQDGLRSLLDAPLTATARIAFFRETQAMGRPARRPTARAHQRQEFSISSSASSADVEPSIQSVIAVQNEPAP